MLEFFQGKSPGPDSTIGEFQIDIEPSGLLDVIGRDRGRPRKPEVRLRNVVVVGFDKEAGAILDGQEIAQVFSGVMSFGQQTRQVKRQPQLGFNVEKTRVGQIICGRTVAVADHPKRSAAPVEFRADLFRALGGWGNRCNDDIHHKEAEDSSGLLREGKNWSRTLRSGNSINLAIRMTTRRLPAI